MDDVERLRRLCVDDPAVPDDRDAPWSQAFDLRTVALLRISALIAASAPAASMRWAVDEAVAAGVTVHELVALLEGMAGVVGRPRTVAAAPRIAAALGYGDDLVVEPGL